jgi:hypothetical protein
MNRDSERRSRHSDSKAPSAPAWAPHRPWSDDRADAVGPPSDDAAPEGATVLTSDDGVLSYTVKPVGARLFIQRTQNCRTGNLAVQCLLIADPDDFGRWCAAEPTRFTYPLLFDRLRRCANDVFDLAS